MDQKLLEAEQTASTLPVADKSCSEAHTPIKKLHAHEIFRDDANLVSPTPEKTEATVNNKFKREPAELPEQQAMDQKLYEIEQTANILPVVHKSFPESHTPIKKTHIHDISNEDARLVSPTPEKTESTMDNKCKREPAELPEKYRHLWEFFCRMTTSLRLLNLRKQSPTFQNISRLVETLTGRKFLYKNIAQIKYILPEVVQTDKILLLNKKTSCMEPYLKVTLLFNNGDTEHADFKALSGLIASRLFQFIDAHSEDDDVPEAELPEPFNQKEITVVAKSSPNNSLTQTLPNLDETEPIRASLLPPSFRRHFSAKAAEKPVKTTFSQLPVSSSSIKGSISNTFSESVKQEEGLQVCIGDTPMKKPLVVNGISVETPDLSTPKRSAATIDDKPVSCVDQNAAFSSVVAKRSLDFSNLDEESVLLEGNCASQSSSSAKEERGVGSEDEY